MKNKNEPKLVLGLDTSISCTGWAILTIEKKPRLIAYGKIQTEHNPKVEENLDLLNRYKLIIEGIDNLFKQYQISAIAIEQPNTSRNMDITRKLIGIFQIVRYFIFLRQGQVAKPMNTMTVKKQMTGYGGTDKYGMVKWVNKLYNKEFKFHKTNKDITDDDTCDAIAVAWVYTKGSK